MAQSTDTSDFSPWEYWKHLFGGSSFASTDTWTSLQTFVKSDQFLKALATGTGVALLGGAIVVGWYLYTPLPPGLYPEDRWPLRRIHARNQFKSFLVKWGVRLGFGKPMALHRRFRDTPVTWLKPNLNIYAEHLGFDGVPVVLYRNDLWSSVRNSDGTRELRPAVVHVYGGGWAFCTSKTYAPHHTYLVQQLDCAVLTIDYRKAPENPFPAGHDDCYNAIRYFYENAELYGVDPTRISVLGDSAGANLAAGVTLRLRDSAMSMALKNQVLISPSTQFVNFNTDSFNGAYPFLKKEAMIMFGLFFTGDSQKLASGLAQNFHVSEEILDTEAWKILKPFTSQLEHQPVVYYSLESEYAGFQRKIMNPYLCPLMAESMHDLPQAFVVACEFDVLRADTLAYGERLKADGVTVKVETFPGVHGTFRYFEELRVGKELMAHVIDFLRKNI
ncbi:hypothetical protein RvY_02249 [Ramazzottius varieornatus]|uniref:Alpha/beta hydrolase fold-3 domain-containing protein n=1 Tax=Ramazzottius varieornatus TaxID=947166 RepID=A0A1D1UR38_RAMVA|nr:hypothetical protein RvY_02249 [Ramazzottius varieornatus]